MKMSSTRRFAEALGSWMHFEACCFRAGLFSESSLKSAIGSVASSLRADHKAARVHADYPLAAIQRMPGAVRKGGAGRKRNVDFALIYDDKRQPVSEPHVLIEAKWAGSSHCKTSSIMGDFIRLSLMKRAHPGTICMFILAGHSKDIDKVLSRRPFLGSGRDVIPCDGTGAVKKFKFLPLDVNHQKAYAEIISEFYEANLNVPRDFSVSGSLPYPAAPTTFKAVAWEVRSVGIQNLGREDWPAAKRHQ